MFRNLFLLTIPGRISGKKLRDQAKCTRLENCGVFFCLIFDRDWSRDWTLGFVTTQIWDFPNIFWFPKIISLKSFSTWRGKSNTKFLTLDIENLIYCQNYKRRVVGKTFQTDLSWSATCLLLD